MKRFCGLFFALLILSFVAAPARADIDYACLNQCSASGRVAADCMSSCSYAPKNSVAKSPTAGDQVVGNRVFKAPVPVGKDEAVSVRPLQAAPEKDYACLNQCVRNGATYAWCSEKCARPACPPGAVLCGSSGVR